MKIETNVVPNSVKETVSKLTEAYKLTGNKKFLLEITRLLTVFTKYKIITEQTQANVTGGINND